MNPKIPQHVAIIMDGNGRWAEQRGLARVEGHKAGVASVKAIIQCCLQKRIACLSLFAFSSENWSRPPEEVDFLMQLFVDALGRECEELHKHGIRILFTGDRAVLSPVLQNQMQEAETLTANNQELMLNILVNYGGKWDVVQATKKIVAAIHTGMLKEEDIDEATFASYLDTAHIPEPDLFIRTSGELRISNFFLWQLAYTELYFATVNWPDFTEAEFDKALAAFSQRKRRFGRILQKTVKEGICLDND